MSATQRATGSIDAAQLADMAVVRRRRASRRNVVESVMPLATIAGLLAVWQGAVVAFDIRPFILPSPLAVAVRLWEWREALPGHLWTTLYETLVGFGVAVLTALPVAVAIVYSRFMQRAIYPILVAMQSVPKIAIAPLLLLWLGFGEAPKLVLVFLVCFFPIVINAAAGLASTPPEYVELIKSLAASPFKVFAKARFPAALPFIFVGLKVGIVLAVIGAVIGEFIGSQRGLGFIIVQSGAHADTALAFGAILILSFMSIGLFYSIELLERLLVPWARVSQD